VIRRRPSGLRTCTRRSLGSLASAACIAPGFVEALVCPGFYGVRISGFWCLTPGGTDGTTGLSSRVSTQSP
jgi:hypothetical protein